MNLNNTTKEKLENFRKMLHDYVTMKLEERDYHGIADAAMDLREIDARVQLLNELTSQGMQGHTEGGVQMKNPGQFIVNELDRLSKRKEMKFICPKCRAEFDIPKQTKCPNGCGVYLLKK